MILALMVLPDRISVRGITQVTVAVRNPAKPDTAWEGLFLVDTGAVDCRVPGRRLRELGISKGGLNSDPVRSRTQAGFLDHLDATNRRRKGTPTEGSVDRVNTGASSQTR